MGGAAPITHTVKVWKSSSRHHLRDTNTTTVTTASSSNSQGSTFAFLATFNLRGTSGRPLEEMATAGGSWEFWSYWSNDPQWDIRNDEGPGPDVSTGPYSQQYPRPSAEARSKWPWRQSVPPTSEEDWWCTGWQRGEDDHREYQGPGHSWDRPLVRARETAVQDIVRISTEEQPQDAATQPESRTGKKVQ